MRKLAVCCLDVSSTNPIENQRASPHVGIGIQVVDTTVCCVHHPESWYHISRVCSALGRWVGWVARRCGESLLRALGVGVLKGYRWSCG